MSIFGDNNVFNVVGVASESAVGTTIFCLVLFAASKVPYDYGFVTRRRENQVASGAGSGD